VDMAKLSGGCLLCLKKPNSYVYFLLGTIGWLRENDRWYVRNRSQTIEVPLGSKIQFTFTTFDICTRNDSVAIQDSNGGTVLIVKGNTKGKLPDSTTSQTNRATVNYVSLHTADLQRSEHRKKKGVNLIWKEL
jgi:hypothetical protein